MRISFCEPRAYCTSAKSYMTWVNKEWISNTKFGKHAFYPSLEVALQDSPWIYISFIDHPDPDAFYYTIRRRKNHYFFCKIQRSNDIYRISNVHCIFHGTEDAILAYFNLTI